VIEEGLSVIVQECPVCSEHFHPALAARGKTARELLGSFQSALKDGLAGGERSVELRAMRQMNQIALSLFQGESDAVDNAFDLIGSAIIILLDADASWIQYTRGDDRHLIVRGNESAVKEHLSNETPNQTAIMVPVVSGTASGEIGVLSPEDPGKARQLLLLMAEECAIVLEIDRLFRLVKGQLNRVFSSMSSFIVLMDRSWRVTYLNQAAEELLECRGQDLVGHPLSGTLQVPWDRARAEGLHDGKGHMDMLQCPSGRKWIDWELSPLEEDGAVVGWVVVGSDRTERQRWVEVARRAERFATTAAMVGSLAHELRNPVSAAKGLVQLLGRRQDQHRAASYSDLIVRELDRVTRLLNEFLLLGQPSDIDAEPLNAASFLEELLPLFEGEAAGGGIEIRLDLAPVPAIMGDPGQLTQLVLNLVRNGVEAVSAGELEPQGVVTVRLRQREDHALLEVRDSGPGIPDKAFPRLFTPFFTTKERGTGLGLAISQAIVHNHGGEIRAFNAPEGGAVFEILLPICDGVKTGAEQVEVVLALSDDILRYSTERALRAANLQTVTIAGLGGLRESHPRLEPRVLVADSPNGDTKGLLELARAWPGTRFVLIGGDSPGDILADLPREVTGAGVEVVAEPVDYGRLVDRVMQTLNS